MKETIVDAMTRAHKTFPSGYWETYFMGQFYKADTKRGLRNLLSEVRKGK